MRFEVGLSQRGFGRGDLRVLFRLDPASILAHVRDGRFGRRLAFPGLCSTDKRTHTAIATAIFLARED